MGPDQPFSDNVRFPRQPEGDYPQPFGPPTPAPAYGGPPPPSSLRSRLLARLRSLLGRR